MYSIHIVVIEDQPLNIPITKAKQWCYCLSLSTSEIDLPVKWEGIVW